MSDATSPSAGVSLNGVAHVYLTVQDFERCLPFYRRLLGFFQMRCLVDTDRLFYCIGGRTGIGIRAADERYRDVPFDQGRAGLHHLCLRARSRDDVDRVHAFVEALIAETGGRVVHPPQEDHWAPGYYSALFEDPDGLRLEVNFVPGKGHLESEVELPLADEVQRQLSESG